MDCGVNTGLKTAVLVLAWIFLTAAFPRDSLARHDPSYTWHTVRTEGFIIYYPEGHELLAQRVLALAPEVHSDVTAYFGFEPRPCPVVLDPGTDIFNGYMSIFPSMVSLYETPLYTVRGFGPGSDLMDLVFTHEYTHYVHLTERLGWYGKLTGIIGEGFAVSNIVSPGWAVEGIAVNTETMFTDGGRGRSPLFRGEMMSFAEGRGLWNLNAAAVSSPYAPPGSRIYLGGYFMVDYLNRAHGQDAFARLSRYQAEHPLGGTGEALRSVTGQYPEQFYFSFLRDFEAQVKTSRDRALSAGLPSGTVVLSDPKCLDSFEHHFWTGSGSIQAIRRGYESRSALVEARGDTGEILAEKPTGVLANISARRLPDGRLAMAEVFYHPLGDGRIDTTDLVIFDPGTMKRERLTRGGHIYSADLSPDGRTFAATRRNGMWIDLVLMDSDGSNVRALVSRPGLYFDAPCWSPDGQKIAAVLKTGRNADIVIVDPADGRMELLFRSDAAEDNEPEFSPDGKWLVFSSDRSGTWNIHAWDLAEKRLFQLTSVSAVAGDPHLSPEGGTLSYSDMVRGVKQVCTMDFNPSGGKELPAEAADGITEPDLERLQPEVSFKGEKGIPLDSYKPFVHLPYVSSDEDGVQAGVFIMGADPVGINTYSANILYGFRSERAGYDISIANRSFWPTLAARVYDTAVEGNTIGGGSSYWFRERGAELSAGMNIIPQAAPSTVTSSFRFGPRLRYFSILEEDLHLSSESNQSVSVFGEFKAERRPDTPARDMVSSFGQSLGLSFEKGTDLPGGDIHGYNVFVTGTQHVPSVIDHHGLALTATHQLQKGILFYNKDLSIPRGYSDDDPEGDLDKRKNLLLSAEYHFPILYTDTGIGLYSFHSDLVKGSLFVDCGAGWDSGFHWHSWRHRARTTIGATLTNRCVLFAVLPVEIGITAGYKTREDEGFMNFLLRLEL